MSYLGKISALVSVNTGDFGPKLNSCARDVRTFAQVVQREIGSSMRDANKAFEGIYTPLQRFERAMRAASSAKLSFVGLPGAIRTVDELQRKLGTLNDRQVAVVLKASGMRSLDDFRTAIQGLTAKNIEVVARVGGLEQLKQLREQMTSGKKVVEIEARTQEATANLKQLEARLAEARAAAKGITVGVVVDASAVEKMSAKIESLQNKRDKLLSRQAKVEIGSEEFTQLEVAINKIDDKIESLDKKHAASAPIADLQRLTAETEEARQKVAELDRAFVRAAGRDAATGLNIKQIDEAIAALSRMGLSADQVKKVIDELLQSDGTAFAGTMRLIKSAAEGIARPLNAAQQELSKLGADVQASFLPTFAALQQEAQGFFDEVSREDAVANAAKLDAQFAALLARVKENAIAVAQLSEAAEKLGSIKTGKELTFAAPELSASLSRSSAIGDRAAGMPAGFIQGTPSLVKDLAQIKSLSEQAVVAFGKLVAARDEGFPLATNTAEEGLRSVLRLLASVQDRAEETITLRVNADEFNKLKLGVGSASLNILTPAEAAVDTLQAKQQELARKIGNGFLTILTPTEAAADTLQAKQQELARKIGNGFLTILTPTEAAADTLQAKQQELARKIGNGFLTILTPTEAAADTLQAKQQELARKIGNGFLTILTPTEAAADTLQAKQQELARKIGNGFLTILTPTEAAADTLQAKQQELARKIGNGFLTILTPTEAAEDTPGRATQLGANYFRDSLRKEARSQVGPDLTAPTRQMGRFLASITSVKTNIDALPVAVRDHFVPAIRGAEREFVRLRALGPAATAEEIENAVNMMRTLEQASARATRAMAFRDAAGGRDAQGLELNLQAKSLTAYQAELRVLAQALGRVSSEARGPAAASFLALQNAIAAAFENSTLDAAATKASIADLRNAAVQATAAVAGMSVGSLGREVARAGDVGRRGFDNMSLAAQQAMFAVDDFFSSTGGLEFRLRAISNNVTQLAFVMGGTTGLFVGLAAVLAGQAAIGIMKFVNGGRTAEDQTKALSDAISRQKSLVEELSQSWSTLADSLGRNIFSSGAEAASQLEKELTAIAKKQKEVRESAVADLDPEVQLQRAEQSRLKREMEGATDPGVRVALQRQLQDSSRREKDAAERASTAGASGDRVAEAIETAVRRFQIALLPVRTGPTRDQMERNAAAVAAAAGAAVPTGSGVEDVREQRRIVQDRIQQLTPFAANASGFLPSTADVVASQELANLQRVLNSLELPLQKALDELSNQIVRASRGAAVSIEQAQADVASAIERGVRGAADFQAALDNTSQQLKDAQKQLEEAQKIEGDPERRQQEVERAQSRVDDVRMRQDAIAERAREVRLGRTFGGERTTQALSQLQGNERFANEYAGLTATVTAAVDKEVAARAALQAAVASGDDAQQAAARAALEAAQAESDLAAAAAEAALALEQAVTRIRKIGADAIAESERMADDAQKRLNENPTFENSQARDRAELKLIRDRERLALANNALDRRRSEIAASSPAIAAIDRQMAGVRNDRERLAEQARISGVQADPAEMERLADIEAALMADRERQMQSLTAAERRQQDAIAQEIAARRRLVEEAEKQRQAEIERGRQRDEQAFGVGGQRSQIDQAMSQAQQAADQARARFISSPTAANRQARDEADGRLRAATQRSQELQDELDAAERRFTGRDDIRQEQEAIRRRDRERADIIARAKEGNRELTPQEQARIDAIDEANREARAEVDRKRRDALKPEQEAADKFAQQQDILARNEAGRRLGLTERERFREDMEVGIGADIRARAAVLQRDGVNPNDFINRALSEQMKTVAPMLEEFRMERETAMLQGPSRAALQVSDVTTSQGQSELNRLLRGDDAAKDVNLAELRKQSDLFQELINVVRNNPLPVLP